MHSVLKFFKWNSCSDGCFLRDQDPLEPATGPTTDFVHGYSIDSSPFPGILMYLNHVTAEKLCLQWPFEGVDSMGGEGHAHATVDASAFKLFSLDRVKRIF